MKFDLGISVYSVPGRSIDTLLNFIEKYHFKSIELWDSPLPDVHGRLSKILEDNELELSVHAPLLDIGDVEAIDTNVRLLHESVHRANLWGAKRVVLHTGVIKRREIDTAIEAAKQVIFSNIKVLEELEIILCIENVGYLRGEFISDFGQLSEFVDNYPNHLVGVVFDIAHANIAGGVHRAIEILGSRIKQVHLSDNNGKVEKHHMPLGKGNINFSALKIDSIQNNIVAIMEITPDKKWKKHLLESRKLLQELDLVS